MKYRIVHTTVYNYSQSVGLCQNEARLQPRNFWRQKCHSSFFEISPEPVNFQERVDFYGNRVTYFAIQQAHQHLSVTAVSEVTVYPKPHSRDLSNPVTWEEAHDLLQQASNAAQFQLQNSSNQYQTSADELFEAQQYVFDSPMIAAGYELGAYAQPSFLPNRPLVAVVQDLMRRIYKDFTYDPSFTTIATPLTEVLSHRRGVCQDFAHLAIGCLRAYGIAARYISGYVETQSATDPYRLVGGDASHAWFAVYIPGSGWLEFDPTNNKLPLDQHITLAWGRDFSDVTPLKGIAIGGGQHTLSVSVGVLRLD